MKKDPAIEQIRRVRHEISAKHGHDTRALIAHYQAQESKYHARLVKESAADYAMR